MTEWKEYKLGEIVSIASGFAYKGEYIGKGENLLLGMGCVSYKEKFLLSGARPYAGDCAERYYAKVGDIVLATRQQSDNLPILGMPAIIPEDLKDKKLIIGANLYRVTNNSDFDNKYIYWLLKTPDYVRYIASCKTGTTVAMITKSDIENFAFVAPDKSGRERILKIMDSLDDKIDLLHRENKTLEAMAETLFRQWFIEEAKEDWEEVSLEYVCERITDGSHYSPESVESGLPMASVKDMEDWGINLNSCRKISKEEFDKLVSADCLPQVNDILIAKDGSYLKHIFVVNKMQEVVILSSIAIIRPNGLYHPYLLSLLLKLDSIKEELKNIVTGAVIPRIVLKDFRKFPIILPPKEKQEKALLFIEPIMKKCFYNREQIQNLIQQRDSLLPKLMSGEVKI